MRKIGYMGLVMLLFVSSVNAQYTTGNQLYELCQFQEDPIKFMPCEFFIIGAWEMYLTAVGFSNSPPQRGICAPENSSKSQTVDIVKNYLESHPENRHVEATALIVLALSEVWPCEQLSDE